MTKMIKAVIIDDERNSRQVLHDMLNKYCIDVTVLGDASGCKEGIELIKEVKPELVFLDIQMPDGSGFNLLEEFEKPSFDVVFVTAFDQYAIKAIKYSALDYLLKPINPQDLIKALDRYREKTHSGDINKRLEVLMQNMGTGTTKPKKIILSTQEGYHVISPDDIVRCQSDSYYTNFYFHDGKRIIVSKTLKEYEELLTDFGFVRSHKSHLVNIKYIKSYMRADGGFIQLTDGTEIPVSRRKRDYIVDIISNI
jgi:two-component system, LytTR family, response regulator